jgi:ABC-type transport system involved in cytochrome c biogenesis permease subunit
MFDLNHAISDWRQDMQARGVKEVEALDELEAHLRDVFEQNVKAGVERQEAFDLASEQLGRSAELAAEFQKLDAHGWLPTRIAGAFILIALGGMVAWLWGRVERGGMELLLACHVFSITIGYFSVLVLGGLGICYVCQRWAREFSIARTELLSRSVLRFTAFSLVLTAGGVVLGALWAKEHFGRFWGWDIREIGGLVVLGWLLLLLAMQRWNVGIHATMILGIGGNVIVALAWFGINLVGHGANSYGTALSYLLFSFIGLNAVLFTIGLLPAGSLRLKQR